MATITICDICKEYMEPLDGMIKIEDKNYKLVLRTKEEGKWKSKDVCVDCIRKNLSKKKTEI